MLILESKEWDQKMFIEELEVVKNLNGRAASPQTRAYATIVLLMVSCSMSISSAVVRFDRLSSFS